MATHFVVKLHLHDGRYHGSGEWPPAPARLYQALMAGAAVGDDIPTAAMKALEWLEALPPPVIVAPVAVRGQRIGTFVPNNDADAVGGRQDRIAEIRTQKQAWPWLLARSDPIIYAWPLDPAQVVPERLLGVAEDLYQCGRGTDMAWAEARVMDGGEIDRLIADSDCQVYRPDGGDHGTLLTCPTTGSARSLVQRHQAFRARLRVEGEGRKLRTYFTQPPKPRFSAVSFNSPTRYLSYELRSTTQGSQGMWPWALERAVELVTAVREGAAARLKSAQPEAADAIEACISGRTADGRGGVAVASRVRFVPIPSIGHEHVDPAIRRVLVEVPATCPIRPNDVEWACAGLELADPSTGEVMGVGLVPAPDERMWQRFSTSALRWQSITPVVMPNVSHEAAPADPRRSRRNGSEELLEERSAVAAMLQALRHAGVREGGVQIRVRRDAFRRRVPRAPAFAAGTRFAPSRLWHVQLQFREAREGLLLLGDGRFTGLGLMVPSDPAHVADEFRFEVVGALPSDEVRIARALRRAVMSLVQSEIGNRALPRFFSGHEPDGAPDRSGPSSHIAFHVDRAQSQLLVVPPHALDRREATLEERNHLARLASALDALRELRIDRSSSIAVRLIPSGVDGGGPSLSATWESASPYLCTRHEAVGDVREAIARDVLRESSRRGLPRPVVSVLSSQALPGRGLEAVLRLSFGAAVAGPLLLGRSRFLGGGRFVPV